MADWNPRANDIFVRSLEVDDPGGRRDFIDQACQGDATLRAEVERLLASLEKAGDFLQSRDERGSEPIREGPPYAKMPFPPGSLLAERYRVRQPLGEGGMGVVLLADQIRPVRRPVAIKLMKHGRDIWQIAARFDQERNALALMDHPHIAKVFDAGVVDIATGEEIKSEASARETLVRRGVPYFVMEHIDGPPITRHCDQHRLSPLQRLELFIPVCEAVQHAHQKGVIHRDLKPSNILVETVDGRQIAKVIDFGVAKAIGPALTEESLDTAVGSIVGTLEYMSPEQAQLSPDIDTRTDVYALGVVLYELLAGTVPHSRQDMQKAGLEEMLRVIKEVDPLAPSSKLSSSDALPSIASLRALIPSRLIRAVRGDLDWIVLKSLEKDRNRRYDSVSGLADDLRRCLHEEPVLARPPSLRYRLFKAYRRHRALFWVTSAAIILLLLGTIGTSVGFLAATRSAQRAQHEANRALVAEQQARRALDEAEQQKAEAETQRDIATSVKNFLRRDLLEQADITTQANSMVPLSDVDEVVDKLRPNPTIRQLVDRAVVKLSAENIDKVFPQQPIVQAELLVTIGFVYRSLGDYDKAEQLFRRARLIYERHLPAGHPSAINCNAHLAEICKKLGHYEQMLALAQEEVTLCRTTLGPDSDLTLLAMNRLSEAQSRLGNVDDAIATVGEAVELAAKNPAISHQTRNRLEYVLASNCMRAGRLDEALRRTQFVYDDRLAELGIDHPDTVIAAALLGSVHLRRNEIQPAISTFETVLEHLESWRGIDHPQTMLMQRNLAYAYRQVGRHADAAPLYETVLTQQKARYGEDAPEVLVTMADLGQCYQVLKRSQKAIEMLQSALDLGAEIEDVQNRITALVRALEQVGRVEEAEKVCRELLARLENKSTGPRVAALLALSTNLLKQAKYADAENYLRELVALDESRAPDRWTKFRARSLLGESLMKQQKYAEAEPLLLSGFEGMHQRRKQMTVADEPLLTKAAARLVQLYQLTENKARLSEWQDKTQALRGR